jgi:hypothetical protein
VEERKAALKLLELATSQISSKYKNELSKKTKDIIDINFNDLIDDKELLEISTEYNLFEPNGMARFLVDFYVGSIESISSQIESVKELIIKQEIGELRGVKEAMQRVYCNPNNKKCEYENIQKKLDSVSGKLKEYILSLISDVRRIDNQKRWVFFINSLWNRNTIDSSIKLVRLCIDALESLVDIQMVVGMELKDNIDSVIYNYKDFYDNELLKGDNCRLLQGYEFYNLQNQEYFLKLSNRVKNIEKLSLTYNDYIKEYVDNIDEYNEVVF